LAERATEELSNQPWPMLASFQLSIFRLLFLIFLFLLGFFKGTSADQDRRFSDKELKLLKTIKFPPQFDTKVTMSHHRSYLSLHLVTPLGRYAQGQLASHSTLGR
jgi:hypothetical protein